jgi:hypothetical protein
VSEDTQSFISTIFGGIQHAFGVFRQLLDALDGIPAGFPIGPADLIAAARIRIADQNDPTSGELAQLRDAYVYALGVVEQTVLAASRSSALELATADQPATGDTRKPTLVSTGQEVTL